jgi:hypothetical protein
MTRSIARNLAGLLVAGLAGCTGSVGGGQSPGAAGSTGTPGAAGNTGTPGTAGNTGAGNMVSTGTGNAGGTGIIGPPPCVGTCVCMPGIPATTQVPRITRVQYDTVVKELLGVTTLTSASNQPPSSLLAEDSTGPLTDISWNGYLSAAEKIATEVIASTTNKSKFITCADATNATCLTDTIKAFGRKLFRRPLTDAEVTSFMRFNNLTPKGTSNEVAESVLFAMLASPSFITLPELGETPEGTAFKLTSHEVATRLSFLLWNSVGDDVLNAEAEAGRLTTGAQIKAQAVRMLASPKAAGVATGFHRLYANIALGTPWTNNTTHTLPGFTTASYTAAMAEMDAFFQDVVVSGGTFADLFTSPVGFVTNATASIYGVTSSATTPTKTMLNATQRPGFLTRVGFLSTHAHEASSSPILRGAFITQRVLALPVGDPDPSFTGMSPPPGNYKTNREAVEALTNVAVCNTCHTTKVNPPGFVLERYNAIGAWQDTDALTGPINSTADVIFTTVPEVKKTITSPAELMAEIAKTPNAQRAYAQKFLSFATGRVPNSNDTCIVDKLTTNMATPTYSIAAMIADYTDADSFRLRSQSN